MIIEATERTRKVCECCGQKFTYYDVTDCVDVEECGTYLLREPYSQKMETHKVYMDDKNRTYEHRPPMDYAGRSLYLRRGDNKHFSQPR